MSFVPHTEEDRARMLSSLGLSNIDELFEEVRDALPPGQVPEIPAASESDLSHELWEIARLNGRPDRTACFRGAGAYEHYIPAAIPHLLSRGEFFTAYTPYQAEISQGTLQAMYEFQTMVCELLGLDVANASMYDGASALAEAALMAMRVTRKRRLLVTEALHPHWLQVLRTYTGNVDADIVQIPTQDGVTSADGVAALLDEDTAAVIIQNPNVFGLIEPIREVGSLLADRPALFIAAAYPIALGLLATPGEAGADIAVAEGQPLGIPLSFGGPYLGLLATRMEHVRQMPGRISGVSCDSSGRRGYVLTLQAREQHIRRERATSNICSNQALCALAATVYLALMGPVGFRTAAERSFATAHELARKLAALPGCSLSFEAPFFNEFVLDLPMPAEDVEHALWSHDIISGLPLGRWWPERRNQMLFCATEIVTDDVVERLMAALKEVLP